MTALNELIEIIKQKRKESDISNTLLRFVQIEAEKLLETEKQQIKDAWNDGLYGILRKGEDNEEQYYNETYKK